MKWPSEIVLHFVFHLQPRSPELYWPVRHQLLQQNWAPAPFLGQCRWKPQGLLGMPSPFNWGGDPNEIDVTKARLGIWKSQAVPRKRPLSCWNVDIKKANASLSTDISVWQHLFKDNPTLFCLLFVTFPCALPEHPCQCCTLTKLLYGKSIIERKLGAIFPL